MKATGQNPLSDAQRRQVAELARALRHQLQWQGTLGADGAPNADPAQLQALADRVRAAKLAKVVGPPVPAEPTRSGQPPSHAVPSPPPVRQRPRVQAPTPHRRVASTTDPAKKMMAALGAGTPAQSNLPRGDASEASAALKVIREELGDCQRCKLGATRRRLVFGAGNPKADLVFVGEAPGVKEDRSGLPFVGKSGDLLVRMIRAMGLRREDVYILNIIKCRPPGNRDPELDEVEACEPFLIKQLEALSPKVIVTLGRHSSQSLLREKTGIKRLRGQWRSYKGIKVMPTFHPSYVLRYPENKRPVWEDLQLVMEELANPTEPV